MPRILLGLVFSQFADTVGYLTEQLKAKGVKLIAIEDIYKFPLLQSATDTLNRQLKSGIDDQRLAELVISLRQDARLCRVSENVQSTEPQVICSLGLRVVQG